MRFVPTAIEGGTRVELEPIGDERGYFARTWCADEFRAHGLNPGLVQCSISFNRKRGTLRGMHWQRGPWEEAKLVRCTRGRIYDVALDVRPGSPTRSRWIAMEMAPDDGTMLYIPEGVAHGFQTLEDDSEVSYQMSQRYHAEAAAGARWNDPAFGIDWPLGVPILSPRDAAHPDFEP